MSQIGEIPPFPPEYVQQSYNDTCAIKSQQLILEMFGQDVTEEQLRQEAIEMDIYNGGTLPEHVGLLLEEHGVHAHQVHHAHVFDLVNELAQGHKVIVGVDSGELWHNDIFDMIMEDNMPDHALIVSAIDTSNPYDTRVILTDPGTGRPAANYSLDEFMDAWQDSDCFMVATDDAPEAGVDPALVNFDYDAGHIPSILEIPFEFFQSILESIREFFSSHFNHDNPVESHAQICDHVWSSFNEYRGEVTGGSIPLDIPTDPFGEPSSDFNDILFDIDGFDMSI